MSAEPEANEPPDPEPEPKPATPERVVGCGLALGAAVAWFVSPGGGVVDWGIGLAIPLGMWVHGRRRERPFDSVLFGLVVWGLWLSGAGMDLLLYRTVNHASLPTTQLRNLVEAQREFREGDLERDGNLDYGTLEELREAMLVPEFALTSAGVYRCTVYLAPHAPEFLWMATVNTQLKGRPHYAVNQTGQLYASTTPMETNPECAPPPGALRYPEQWGELEEQLSQRSTRARLGWYWTTYHFATGLTILVFAALLAWTLFPLPRELKPPKAEASAEA